MSGNLQTVVQYCLWEAGRYLPSFLLRITRAGIHNQKKTLLSWTDFCSGSVSPVSTGTLSTLLNDLPPPSYPEYSPSFLFTITRAGIHKQKKLCWAELSFVQTLYPLFPLGPSALSSMICHLHPTLDTRPLFSYILPELLFITKRKLCLAELTCVQALYPLFPLRPSAPSSMICHLHLTLGTRPCSPSTITRYVSIRETREGWPLLTVGTWNWGEWGHKKDKWKGFFPGWFFGLVVPVQYNYLLTYDSYVPVYNRFHRGEWLDTPGPLNGTSEASAIPPYEIYYTQGHKNQWSIGSFM